MNWLEQNIVDVNKTVKKWPAWMKKKIKNKTKEYLKKGR